MAKDDTLLTCTLQLAPAGHGAIGLAFLLANPGTEAVAVEYFQPFIDFELAVEAADGPIPVVQPAYESGAGPVAVTIAGGATARIETPIRLHFDPHIAPSGGDVPAVWTLRHAPVPVRVTVTLHLSGARVAPAEAAFDPQEPKSRAHGA